MRGRRHSTTGLPRNPAPYHAHCDARIAELRLDLAKATGPDAWERRRDLQRRIDGYRLVKDVVQELAQ